MTNKITLITPPDDIFDDALRMILVDLTQEQSQLVSDALISMDISINIVAYVWNNTNTIEWLIEKKHKETTDSINYAERIQRSFLATKEELKGNFKEYFKDVFDVFYSPL